ncbi:MAG: DUF2240 family protein [Methanomassiliicoccales archaeon]
MGMDELQKAVAVVFKRKGKKLLSEMEFVQVLAYEMRFSGPSTGKLTPKDAQSILDQARRAGLLSVSNDLLKATFDYADADISYNYYPDKAAIMARTTEAGTLDLGPKEQKVASLYSRLITIISQGGKKQEAVARVNRVQDKLAVDAEVAALVVARESGADILPFLEEARQEILRR